MKKYALIPVEDIEKLEEARKLLFEAFCPVGDFRAYMKLNPITESMWKITHKKYEVIEK